METALVIVLSLVFWGSFFLVGLSYALYPDLVVRLARRRCLPEPGKKSDEDLPEVAVLLAVYNEEAVLEATLESIFASDYPGEKLSVWIGSDGSTDRSHEIIESFQERFDGLDLRIFSGRNGKIRIVNRRAEDAAGKLDDPETAVFALCDANVTWAPDMLRRLVGHFQRDGVGLVAPAVMDAALAHEGIGHEEEAYIGRENRIKHAEGVLWGSMMGAFGACYVLRARLFQPVPETYVVDDFYQTMACLESGHEAIVDLDAICHESVSTDIREEFRRKRRIAMGNFQNLAHFRRFLRPWNCGIPCWFAFWSHKGLRWYGPQLLLAGIVACLALAFLQPFYLLPLAGIVALFLAAGVDSLLDRFPGAWHFKPIRFARYFFAMNTALLLGWFTFLRGVRSNVWEPTKRVGAQSDLTCEGTTVESR